MIALIQCQLHLVHFLHSGIGRTLISTKLYRVQDFFGLHVNQNIVTPFLHPDTPLELVQTTKIKKYYTQEEQAKYFHQFFLDELPSSNIITPTPNNTSDVLFSNGRTPSSVYIDGFIETNLVDQFSNLRIEDSFITSPTDQQLDLEHYVENAQGFHFSNLNISDNSTALVIIRQPIPSHVNLDSYVESELVNSFGNLTIWDSFNTTPTVQQLDYEFFINNGLSQHVENLSLLDF